MDPIYLIYLNTLFTHITLGKSLKFVYYEPKMQENPYIYDSKTSN